MPSPEEVNKLADDNLRRVCALVGASYSPDHASFSPVGNPGYPGPWARLEVADFIFYIVVGHVRCERKGGYCVGTTCYYTWPAQAVMLPKAEMVASALLLLHHDPSIFRKWQLQDGPHV